jgi:hypothetical protein
MSDIDLYIDAAPIEMEVSGAQGASGSIDGTPNHITFDATPTAVPTTEGTVSWNADDHTLNIQTDLAGVVQQVGQEQHIRVRNTSGSTIQNGSVVYLSGASGQRPLVQLADADSDSQVLSTIGVATDDIAHNAFGYVTTMGLVRNVNTNGMTEGNAIYLSTTAGTFTQSVPTGNKVRIGWCIIAGVNGTILVHVDRQSVKSADILDATSDANTNPQKVLKTGSAGEVTLRSLFFATIDAGSIGSGWGATLTSHNDGSPEGNPDIRMPTVSGTLMVGAGNLSELTNTATSRTNIGLGSGDSPTFTNTISTGYIKTGSTVFANLPSAATAGAGARHYITDCNTTTFLATAAGGGANQVPVVSNGTNWLVG